MKKFFAFAGLMAAAAMSLTNCQVREAAELSTNGLTIIADLGATRTTNSGLQTLWAENDAVNVFHATPGSSEYVSDGKFTVSEGAGQTVAQFTGETQADIASGEAFDWYALYPYSSKVMTPASADSEGGFTYIGRSNGLDQPGYDDMSKLSASHCPLYAVAKNVKGAPAVGFKHLSSVIEFNVTNETGGEILVNSLTLDASEDIVGSYYIDFTGETPVLTGSEGRVYSSATVNVTAPEPLASGQTAKLYLAVKPYTQSAKEAFKVSVKATVGGVIGTSEVELYPTGGQAVFKAGKIKKVTVPVKAVSLPETSNTVADALNGTVGDSYEINDALVTLVAGNNVFATDATGTVLVYNSKNTLKLGDKISISGATKAFNNLVEFSGATVTKTGEETVSLTPAQWTDAQMAAAYGNAQIAYVSYTVTLSNASNGIIPGTDAVLYLTKASGVSTSKDKTYTLTGYVYGWLDYTNKSTGAVTPEVCMYVDSATEVLSEATLSVSPTSVSIDQTGGTAEATVTSDNDNWTISNDADWLNASKSGSTISFSASENTGTKRSATVTLTHSNGSLTATVKVSQAGAEVDASLSLGTAKLAFTAKETEVKFVKVNSDNTEWTVGTPSESWLTVTKVVEDESAGLNVSVSENTGGERTATVQVTHSNGEKTSTLTVTQSAAATGSAVTYSKITSASDLTAGNYIFVCEDTGYVMNGGLSNLDSAGGLTGLVSGNTVTTDESCYFTYDPSNGSFKSASGLYLAPKANNGKGEEQNGLRGLSEYDETVCQMTVSFEDGNAHVVSPLGPVLRFNPTTGQNRFRFYKSTSYTNQKPIQLYKAQ